MQIFLIFFFLVFSHPSLADETDNFSNRDLKLKDSSAIINNYINAKLNLVVAESNKEASACDYKAIFKNFKYVLDTNFPDIASELKEDPNIERKNLFEKKSIYRAYTKETGALSPTININGFTVGTDKVDHFFSSGSAYWLKYIESKNLKECLQYGVDQEDSFWGLAITGVKAYADMAANYSGFLFWNQLLGGQNPYIKCEQNKWSLKKQFNIAEYVDASWDEAINCSSFASPKMAADIGKEISNLNLGCPVSPSECVALTKKYPMDIAKYILHPKCRGTGSSFYEPSKGYIAGFRGDFFTQAREFKMANLISELKGSHKSYLDYLNSKFFNPDDPGSEDGRSAK